jgi:hypothetical protein
MQLRWELTDEKGVLFPSAFLQILAALKTLGQRNFNIYFTD